MARPFSCLRLQALIHVLTYFLAILPSCTTTAAAAAAAVVASRGEKPETPKPALRILPLGDSITFGQGSSDGNGYRLALHNLLSQSHAPTYIGRERSGTMKNNHHEGHKGFPIGPVGNTGTPNYALRPNIVLLLAGTNDIVFNINVAGAPDALANVIDEIVAACPDAVVLVGTVPALRDEGRAKKAGVFNGLLPGLVGGKAREGKKVMLVDMGGVQGVHVDAEDGIHPTDAGYAIIAKAWFGGIVEAGEKGWIERPVEVKKPHTDIDADTGAEAGAEEEEEGGLKGIGDKIGKVVVSDIGSVWFPFQVVVVVTAAVSLGFGIRWAGQVGLTLDWRSLLRFFRR